MKDDEKYVDTSEVKIMKERKFLFWTLDIRP